MEKEVKDKILRIINKLYVSIGVVVLAIILISGYYDVKKQIVDRTFFNRAHESLERIAKYNPQQGNLTLLEGRELVALEANRRMNPMPLKDDPKKGSWKERAASVNPTYAIIDSVCLNFDGSVNTIPDDLCAPITIFEPGTPYEELLRYIGIFLGTALGLFLFRKWATWLIM